jgi:hypothetical protein
MRISPAVITIALIGLAACSGAYGPSGPGGGGGGPVGSVTVGPGIEFVSRHNGSRHPAVDTIQAGATLTWTWSGNEPHNVRSIGSPSFQSSATLAGSGTYAVRFDVAGTYRYDCVVHGQAMTGTIVVTAAPQAAAAIVGRAGRPTDFVPNSQHLRLAPSAAAGVHRRSVSPA